MKVIGLKLAKLNPNQDRTIVDIGNNAPMRSPLGLEVYPFSHVVDAIQSIAHGRSLSSERETFCLTLSNQNGTAPPISINETGCAVGCELNRQELWCK